jgi:DNA polymerase II small subunit/DNA polymerase delta subunit B
MCKYVPTVASAKLNLAEATLKWRHKASVPLAVAPDTLWCGHLFITINPLIIVETLDIFAIGYEPRFQVTTRHVKDKNRRFRVP